jgi:hypothetical protein
MTGYVPLPHPSQRRAKKSAANENKSLWINNEQNDNTTPKNAQRCSCKMKRRRVNMLIPWNRLRLPGISSWSQATHTHTHKQPTIISRTNSRRRERKLTMKKDLQWGPAEVKSNQRACLGLKPTSLAGFIVPVARTQAHKGPRWLTEDGLVRQVSSGLKLPGKVSARLTHPGPHKRKRTLKVCCNPAQERYRFSTSTPRSLHISPIKSSCARQARQYTWQRSVQAEDSSQGQVDSNRVGINGWPTKHHDWCRLTKESLCDKDFETQRNTYRSTHTADILWCL